MPLIAEHLGVNPGRLLAPGNDLLPPGNIGFEIELEGGNRDEFPIVDGWELTPDGSLRDGMEYIFDGPQHGDRAVQSIRNMAFAMEEFKPEPTFRCSTHIHMDVRDMNWDQYQRLILLYMIYEDVMFDHCDDYRRHSNFCVPFQNNDWLGARFGREIIGAASDRHRFSHLHNWPKYTALNLQVTQNHGTVEFRGSHAMTTEEELMGLAQRMLNLKSYAMNNERDSFEFITLAGAEPLDVVFPTGLRVGYRMSDGALDQGLSTAMHALLTSTMAQRQEAANPWAPRDRVNVVDESIRTVLRNTIRYNEGRLRELNIAAPIGGNNLQSALSLLDALNRLNGVTVRLTEIINVRVIPGAHMGFLEANLGRTNDLYGYNLSAQMLG